jgi:hypothetical protein
MNNMTALIEYMVIKRTMDLFTIFLLAILFASAPAKADPVGRDMGCSPTVANPCSGGSRGSSSSGSSAGAAIGQALGQAIGEALRGNPEEDTRRKAAEEAAKEAARSRAEEQARKAEEQARILDEEKKDRLMGSMMDVGDSSQLDLKPMVGVDSGAGLSLMPDSASVNTPQTKGAPPQADKGANNAKSTAYFKGFEHASQCFSQSAGTSCVGSTAAQQQSCVADYQAGYDSGRLQKNIVLQEAYQTGQGVAAQGELASALSDQRAQGPCQIEWIESYNRGYFQGKNAKAQQN